MSVWETFHNPRSPPNVVVQALKRIVCPNVAPVYLHVETNEDDLAHVPMKKAAESALAMFNLIRQGLEDGQQLSKVPRRSKKKKESK